MHRRMVSRNLVLGILFFTSLLNIAELQEDKKTEVDPRGYITYCPCVGQFGNQVEHFLGVLSFAHDLNRTLILPPWVEYRSPTPVNIPFEKYLGVPSLLSYHRVITMERFMEEMAPDIWPHEKRIAFCSAPVNGEKGHGCNVKGGNPFRSFWEGIGIDFDHSEIYKNMGSRNGDMDQWNMQYPPGDFPVLAFISAPASFPVEEKNWRLHQYVTWSPQIDQLATEYVRTHMAEGKSLGIHLRLGHDWVSACNGNVNTSKSPIKNVWASANCLGYNLEYGVPTMELCHPSDTTILTQVRTFVTENKVRYVFVACDVKRLVPALEEEMTKIQVQLLTAEQNNPRLDLAILGRTDYFIGSCVSTFTAIAVRERRTQNRPVEFWAFQKPDHYKFNHTEL